MGAGYSGGHQPVISIPAAGLAPHPGREIYPAYFAAGYIFKAAALGIAGAVLNFHEENHFLFLGDNVYFAGFGFPVAVNYLKVVLLQQFAGGCFGFQALFGSFDSQPPLKFATGKNDWRWMYLSAPYSLKASMWALVA